MEREIVKAYVHSFSPHPVTFAASLNFELANSINLCLSFLLLNLGVIKTRPSCTLTSNSKII